MTTLRIRAARTRLAASVLKLLRPGQLSSGSVAAVGVVAVLLLHAAAGATTGISHGLSLLVGAASYLLLQALQQGYVSPRKKQAGFENDDWMECCPKQRPKPRTTAKSASRSPPQPHSSKAERGRPVEEPLKAAPPGIAQLGADSALAAAATAGVAEAPAPPPGEEPPEAGARKKALRRKVRRNSDALEVSKEPAKAVDVPAPVTVEPAVVEVVAPGFVDEDGFEQAASKKRAARARKQLRIDAEVQHKAQEGIQATPPLRGAELQAEDPGSQADAAEEPPVALEAAFELAAGGSASTPKKALGLEASEQPEALGLEAPVRPQALDPEVEGLLLMPDPGPAPGLQLPEESALIGGPSELEDFSLPSAFPEDALVGKPPGLEDADLTMRWIGKPPGLESPTCRRQLSAEAPVPPAPQAAAPKPTKGPSGAVVPLPMVPLAEQLPQEVLQELADREETCWAWVRTGYCPRGMFCQWKHPPLFAPKPHRVTTPA